MEESDNYSASRVAPPLEQVRSTPGEDRGQEEMQLNGMLHAPTWKLRARRHAGGLNPGPLSASPAILPLQLHYTRISCILLTLSQRRRVCLLNSHIEAYFGSTHQWQLPRVCCPQIYTICLIFQKFHHYILEYKLQPLHVYTSINNN